MTGWSAAIVTKQVVSRVVESQKLTESLTVSGVEQNGANYTRQQ